MYRQNNNSDDYSGAHFNPSAVSTLDRSSVVMDDPLDGSRVELLPPGSTSTLGSTAPSPLDSNGRVDKEKKPNKLKGPMCLHCQWPLCLQEKSWTVKCWINFLILLVFALLLVIIFLATFGTTEKVRLCLTPTCIKAASYMISSMDNKTDPCEDFYQYACGGWDKNHMIPDDVAKYSNFRMLTDSVQAKLKDIFERPIDAQDIPPIKNLKLLYKSCTNEYSLEALGTEPVIRYLEDLGSWPVLKENWNETEFDLLDLLARLVKQDIGVFIQLRVGPDISQSNVSIVQIDQGSLGLPSLTYFLSNSSVYQAYNHLAVSLTVELGASRATAERDMSEVLQFESRLGNITVSDQERRNLEKAYKKMTVGDLKNNVTDKIEWLRYLRSVFMETGKDIEESRPIGVFVSEYFTRLAKLLEVTPKRTIANYVFWRAVYSKMSFLPEKFILMRRELHKAILGTNTEMPRWKQCVAYVTEDMAMATGRLFVDEHFDKRAKEKASEMIDHVRMAFNELLKEVSWMNDETRKVAMEKSDKIREAIGYPDFIIDDEQLTNAYEGLSMNSSTLFDNAIHLTKWTAGHVLSSLDQKTDGNGWSKSPAVVNAYYSASKNLILFPAGILQPPFYHSEFPGYLNYGSMGMIIGHEITHGFDDKGRRFDKDGNMVQWWPSDVIEKFMEKADCIIKQYSEYEILGIGLQINGRQTQGENIADNGGLKQAFRAYRKFIDERGREEPQLPGLNLSPNHLFFLSFAQIWCQESRPESLIRSVYSERHSPDRYRVIGSLVNSKDFSEVYKCPSGSKMNPVKKCTVW